ncbi:MAG TPA: cob(I)yrinic acid a,c-diamide adenosyltransferase [Amycolatopsis sp.]|jgi:cob(I)alamin adenosyltransferase
MVVRINRVYTKVGDSGSTALGDGSRVPKTSPRLGAYAETDEANSVIGLAVSVGGLTEELGTVLRRVQNDLFDVGADLCLPIQPDPPYQPLRITEVYLERLESWCDEFNERLPKLTSFILPGGTPGAAYLHQARTVTRRAERAAWALIEAEPDTTNPIAAKYLNRLSDLLFILARLANPEGDVLWQPGG